MSHVLLAGLYPLVVLAAAFGWGWLAARPLGATTRSAGAATLAAVGLAVLMIAGGWIHLAEAVSPPLLRALLAVGAMLAAVAVAREPGRLARAVRGARRRLRGHPWLLVAALVNTALLALIILSHVSVAEGWFNTHDDLQGYFLFPAKMLQLGAMGPDPFSQRRVISSLGGKSFLDAFALADLGTSGLGVMDGAVGLLLLVLVLREALDHFRARPWIRQVILFVAITHRPPAVNITGLQLGVALFLALLLLADRIRERGRPGAPDAVALALLLAGVALLKNSLLPSAAILGGAAILWAWAGTGRTLRTLAMVAGVVVALIAPWMAALKASSGTLLYPLLGRGVHGSVHGDPLPPLWRLDGAHLLRLADELTTPVLGVAYALAAACIARARCDRQQALVPAAAVLSVLVVAFFSRGYGVDRFTYAPVFAFVLWSAASLLHAGGGPRLLGLPYPWLRTGLVAALLALTLVRFSSSMRRTVERTFSQVVRVTPEQRRDRERYRALQESIPPGAAVLEWLDHAYWLDFRRNPVLVNDMPGDASPPPGMPVDQDGEALARYLLDRSVRYVAYSHGSEASFPRARFGGLLAPDVAPWMRSLARNCFLYQDRMAELARTRRVVFDDGRDQVIDLATPAPATGAAE